MSSHDPPSSYMLHGDTIDDPYLWLETPSPQVTQWENEQNQLLQEYLNYKTQLDVLYPCLRQLYLHNTYIPPFPVLDGTKAVSFEKTSDESQLRCYLHTNQKIKLLVNPNHWPVGTNVDYWSPSPDGSYLAIGISEQGNEESVIHIIKTSTGE